MRVLSPLPCNLSHSIHLFPRVLLGSVAEARLELLPWICLVHVFACFSCKISRTLPTRTELQLLASPFWSFKVSAVLMISADSNFVWLPSLHVWSYRLVPPPSGSTSSMTEKRSQNAESIRRCSHSHEEQVEKPSPEITFELRQPSRSAMRRETDSGELSSDLERGESEHVCPICLGAIEEFKDASLWWCLHRFCISCIEEWSRLRRSCPLCKAEFNGWYQSVKGQNKREERILPPLDYRPSLDYRLSMAEEYRLSDFRLSISEYRPSTDDRQSISASLHPERRSSSSRSQARQEREHVRNTMTFRSRLRLQQLMQSRISRSYRRSIPLPRQRCFISPAERERLTAEVLAERALTWRTSIYRKGLKAVALTAKRRLEVRQYDLDAKVRAERRLKPWVMRELKAILGDEDHALLVHLVLSLWFAQAIEATDDAEKLPENAGSRRTSSDSRTSVYGILELEKCLGDKASAFWHELRCFAECPYTMETYDSIVVYVKGDRHH